MKTIHKYPLKITDFQEVEMPEGAMVLSVVTMPAPIGTSTEQVCVYAEVDTERPLVPRRFRIYGTGHEMNHQHEMEYIGTVTMSNRALVWHVYENYMKES